MLVSRLQRGGFATRHIQSHVRIADLPLVSGLRNASRLFSSTSTSLSHKRFDKILVSNRGEIACRVIKTAKSLGIKTVAVFSDADRFAQHVEYADEAYHIGLPPATESYLRGEKIIEVCKASGAQAVHPGYGFLSENIAFSKQCKDSGIVFIGPPSEAIHIMGSKSESKDVMIKAGVPVTPGYHSSIQDDAVLLAEAEKIGWPVMIKAVFGGGGKGMRAVYKKEDFLDALSSCQREAKSSFGDGAVLIEKLVQDPRHVEVQVFGDTHGGVVHLLDRDCSVQRRHQKVIEEAPAPNLDPAVREAMFGAAVACAKAVGYVGAGTVEFLVDSVTNEFYFCEMNTRLQVEHPVTELVTGVDLVEWQLRIAAGERIPLTQEQIVAGSNGFAMEARIYAENPVDNFLPASGMITHMSTPVSEIAVLSPDGVRVDSGVVSGDVVSPFYDPMIAKLIVKADDRTLAVKKMEQALQGFQITGMPNNINFLLELVRNAAFSLDKITTSFLPIHIASLMNSLQAKYEDFDRVSHHAVFALAAYAKIMRVLEKHSKALTSEAGAGSDGCSVWDAAKDAAALTSWRAHRPVRTAYRLAYGADVKQAYTVDVLMEEDGAGSGFSMNLQAANGTASVVRKCGDCRILDIGPLQYRASFKTGFVADMRMQIGGKIATGRVCFVDDLGDGKGMLDVWMEGITAPAHAHMQFEICPAEMEEVLAAASEQVPMVVAPMPGRVVKVCVENGAQVKQGDRLVILEAMKMEHVIMAPLSGVVEVCCAEGDAVEDGSTLAVVTKTETKASEI